MSMWLDLKGPISADTVYDDSNNLLAKDVAFTLPGLEFETAELQAMGSMDVPVIGRINNMELSITKIGMDNGLRKLNKLEKQNLEFRWVQEVVDSEGGITQEGCKAFVRTMPTSTPEFGVEVGSNIEGECTYSATRIRIVIGGEEWLVVDRLAGVLQVNGTDYMSTINSLL